MKRLLSLLPFSFLVVLLVSPAFSAPASHGISVTSKKGQTLYLYEDYHALVIGVGKYEKWPQLPDAVNDARDVAQELKKLGFEVTLVLDPTHKEMKAALSTMAYKTGNEVNRGILFYYAGHGETQILADKTKMGYIIPKDCPLLKKDSMGFASHAISMKDIESISWKIRSRHVMMLFDSCFSISFFSLWRAVPQDITDRSALPVRQYMTAGREKETRSDRSIFKRCLLIGLGGDADLTGDGYLTGSELGMYLRDKVTSYTRREQHPQYGTINNPDLDRGDFVFVPIKIRQKDRAEKAALQKKEAAAALELKRLQEERRKNEELVAQMKRLLEAKEKRSEEQLRREAARKKAMEEELKRLRAEREKASREKAEKERIKAQEARRAMDERLRKQAAERKAQEEELKRLKAEERTRREAAEKKTLLEELKQLKAERAKTAHKMKEAKSKQDREQRLAHIPKKAKKPKIRRIKLRSVPGIIWKEDIEAMVENFNFFVKLKNEKGDFPNSFVDNGDGTITDWTTGLMWQKGGSSSALHAYDVKKYAKRLNKERFSGHNNWRVPTLEELCSLLEPAVNDRGLHIDPLFDHQQKECWTLDGEEGTFERVWEYSVSFSGAEIQRLMIRSSLTHANPSCFVRAVRTIK